MPTLASVSLNDGAPTPAAHVFSPINIVGDVAVLKERTAAGIPQGFPQLSVSIREPAKSGVFKMQVKLAIPKTITSTGSDGKTVTSVDYSHLCNIEILCPDRGTTAERKDLIALACSALQNADIKKVLVDLEHYY